MTAATLRIAACQITSVADPAGNLALMESWVRRAADGGARVVVFPEATMAHFGSPLAAVAQPIDGPWATAVSELADAHSVLIAAGMFTPDGDRVRNTVLLSGLGHHTGYHKIHLYDAFGYRESDTVAPGTQPVTVTVDDVVLGVATCYDVRFPALFQQLATSGATAILLPASWGAGPGKAEQWNTLVRARALDSGSWIVGCDQADPKTSDVQVDPGAPTGVGCSLIADPLGGVTAQLAAAPGLIFADVAAAATMQARSATGVLTNRAMF
ncbi:carbon-nitrogen hydrolase family protein [Mycolicibacterium sp. HK-90]|uniref:carbon-nitrogen hydrolase family protein n=1 Tax=Mycolicibacterium sp. HK-90 TaxID=3056937 RepID=UPI0026590989|nr:carbon-nitrogen hydrolase family protein [Mycolicibacterium sp. HK-90]WKG05004.1 carbon-nitrogen hydrolase family protein [Mycolicibacterium sp. HK-90]